MNSHVRKPGRVFVVAGLGLSTLLAGCAAKDGTVAAGSNGAPTTAALTTIAPAPSDASTTVPDQKTMDSIIKGYHESGKLPISDHDGKSRGWVDAAAVRKPPPTRKEDIAIVFDDNGNKAGYFLNQVGFLETSVVEAADFDLAKTLADEKARQDQARTGAAAEK